MGILFRKNKGNFWNIKKLWYFVTTLRAFVVVLLEADKKEIKNAVFIFSIP